MLRLVERVMGEGDVRRSRGSLSRIGYTLNVYREWTPSGAALVAGDFVVDGHLLPEGVDLGPLVGTDEVLTLVLDDGRLWDFYVVSEDGAVTAADGRGLYRPE